MNFKAFKVAVAAQFDKMSKTPLFRAHVDKDALWATYLASYPEGSNPVYKQRTEHDCNCCKQFVRAVGDVVAIIDGKVVTIWDVVIKKEPEYQAVADAMAAFVKGYPVSAPFVHYERTAGTDRSFVDSLNSHVTSWDHFYVTIPREYVVPGKDIASRVGAARTNISVFSRALSEIDPSAVDTVLDLIAQNSIYRGEEHKWVLTEFRKMQHAYAKVAVNDRDTFAWAEGTKANPALTNIRNSAIGTLLVDLSNGDELEAAVRSFESKVAPTNYRRTKALVTPAMIAKAKVAVEALGLTSALSRRYATLEDINITNVLFADRSARKRMASNPFDEIADSIPKTVKQMDRVEEVSIEKFVSDILPRATSLELMLERAHASNFVSLIAPVDPSAERLFKWNNQFSWSYTGDVTDSIKERVKKAGGNVDGEFCCRLAWFNHDDLDFHMEEPGKYEISFMNRSRKSPSGGRLDVDMNAGHGTTREPVENIVYDRLATMKEGTYKLKVHNFSKREMTNVGFEVEVSFGGNVYNFAYPQAVGDNAMITVAQFSYSKKDGLKLVSSLPHSTTVQNVWNVNTNTFHHVNAVMMSPNYWDGQGVGNKHFFFMLDQCKNDGQARGFFNEYLREELNPHRKVIEMVGSKMLTDKDDQQLSGVGFSSTQRNHVLCRVGGAVSRVVKIVF